jgi:hypothetical protein
LATGAFRFFFHLAEVAIGASLFGKGRPLGDGFTLFAQATPTFDAAGE